MNKHVNIHKLAERLATRWASAAPIAREGGDNGERETILNEFGTRMYVRVPNVSDLDADKRTLDLGVLSGEIGSHLRNEIKT